MQLTQLLRADVCGKAYSLDLNKQKLTLTEHADTEHRRILNVRHTRQQSIYRVKKGAGLLHPAMTNPPTSNFPQHVINLWERETVPQATGAYPLQSPQPCALH